MDPCFSPCPQPIPACPQPFAAPACGNPEVGLSEARVVNVGTRASMVSVPITERIVTQERHVPVPVPQDVPVPYEVIQRVPAPYPVPVPVRVPQPYEVIRTVDVQVPRPVDVPQPYEVPRPYPVQVSFPFNHHSLRNNRINHGGG